MKWHAKMSEIARIFRARTALAVKKYTFYSNTSFGDCAQKIFKSDEPIMGE
jgi:hypothetical protein